MDFTGKPYAKLTIAEKVTAATPHAQRRDWRD